MNELVILKKEETTMLKITKAVAQVVASMSGCGKVNDNRCGIRARNG